MNTRVPVLASIILLAFFAGATGVRLAYTLAYVLILILIAAWIWARSVSRRVSVRRDSPHGNFMVGDVFEEQFTVHNRSRLPLAYCEIRDRSQVSGYVPGRACALGAGDAVSWRARGVFDRRGRHAFGPLEARLGDPFGLFPRTVRVAPRADVIVYPALLPVENIGTGWSGGTFDDSLRGRALDVAPDVSSVREYQTADGMSRIHWKSTARRGKLMSRTYDTKQSSDLLIVLDLAHDVHFGVAPESTLEYAISITASIVHSATRRGRAVSLVTNDAAGTVIPAGRGEAQRVRLLDYLALADGDGAAPLAEVIARHGALWRGKGGLVIVTPSADRGWIEAALDVGVRGQRHLAVQIDAATFSATGPPLRVAAAWRLALDWWVIHRGDLAAATPRRASSQ